MERGVLRDIKGTERMVCSVSQTHTPHLGVPGGTQLSIIQSKRPTVGGGRSMGKPSEGRQGI